MGLWWSLTGVFNENSVLPMFKDKKFTSHALCHVTRRKGAGNYRIFVIPDPYLPIQYVTFIGLWWRLMVIYRRKFYNGRFLFSKSESGPNFRGFQGLGVMGLKKLRFLLQKAPPCTNPRCLSHFGRKSVEGSDLQVRYGKKIVTEDSHRNEVSPLIQCCTTVRTVMKMLTNHLHVVQLL